MANPFDALQLALHQATTAAFGYDASWVPSTGGGALTARVHFREPTEAEKLGAVAYTPSDYFMEWYVGDLTGLFEATRGKKVERVTINEIVYVIRYVRKMHDGKTYSAHLERI